MPRELTDLERQVIDMQIDFLKLENANYRQDILKIIITFVLIILILISLFVGAFFYQQAGFLNFLGGYEIENKIEKLPDKNDIINKAETYGKNSYANANMSNININSTK